jgi:hypothetical protein
MTRPADRSGVGYCFGGGGAAGFGLGFDVFRLTAVFVPSAPQRTYTIVP